MSTRTKAIRGYMCKVVWEHDFQDSGDPGTIHTCLDKLRQDSPCVHQCGIVEVEVRLVQIVQESDFSWQSKGVSQKAPATRPGGDEAKAAAPEGPEVSH